MKKRIELSDIADLKSIQEIQDAFSNATGIPCLTLSGSEHFTKVSNMANFCEYVRTSKKCNKLCEDCGINLSKQVLRENKTLISNCHLGLKQIISPLNLYSSCIGSLIVSPILEKDEDTIIDIKKLLKIII